MKEYKPRIRMELVNIILFPLIAVFTVLNQKIVSGSFGMFINTTLSGVLAQFVPSVLMIWLIYKIAYVIRLSYTIDDKGNIVKTKGVIGRFRQDIPYKRITNIHKNRNWLYRILGLTQVQIQTAGSSEVEMTLDGLIYGDGEEIYETLKKFKGIKGDGT